MKKTKPLKTLLRKNTARRSSFGCGVAFENTHKTPPTQGKNAKTPPTQGKNAKTPPTQGKNAKTPPTQGKNAKTPPTQGKNAKNKKLAL
ncbi:hypothetical protein ACR9KD_05500 [Helicobacter pylori]